MIHIFYLIRHCRRSMQHKTAASLLTRKNNLSNCFLPELAMRYMEIIPYTTPPTSHLQMPSQQLQYVEVRIVFFICIANSLSILNFGGRSMAPLLPPSWKKNSEVSTSMSILTNCDLKSTLMYLSYRQVLANVCRDM